MVSASAMTGTRIISGDGLAPAPLVVVVGICCVCTRFCVRASGTADVVCVGADIVFVFIGDEACCVVVLVFTGVVVSVVIVVVFMVFVVGRMFLRAMYTAMFSRSVGNGSIIISWVVAVLVIVMFVSM